MDKALESLVCTITTLELLTKEMRFKGIPCIQETVSDHITMGLQIFAHTHQRLPESTDKLRAILMFVIHDNAESIVGDFIEKTDEFRIKEDLAMRSLLKEYPHLLRCYEEYEERESFEAKVVKALDVLCGTLKIFFNEGRLYRLFKRTREEEDRLFFSPKGLCVYSDWIHELRDEMQRKGWFWSLSGEDADV